MSSSDSGYSTGTMGEESKRRSNVLTIAISGCTSSGKTTLALLLSEIFAPFSASQQFQLSESPLVGDLRMQPIEERRTAASTSTIHQDNFFLPKASCPFVSFYSTVADEAYVEASVRESEENAAYFYSRSGLQNTEFVFITGPNTDCQDAVDFGNLLRNLQSAQSGFLESELTLGFTGEDADRQKLADHHARLIRSMRETIASFYRSRTALNDESQLIYLDSKRQEGAELVYNHWVFVEGFLLFSKADTTDDTDLEGETDESDDDDDLYAEVEESLKAAVKVEVKRRKLELKQLKHQRPIAKEALMNAFDIKLFLPTSKEIARQRRMTRLPYVDEPIGRRKPGQMWKTEGYFEEVVWRGYEKDFDWLLRHAGQVEVDGVFVRAVDASVEDTVRWAVDVILGVLKAKSQK